MHEDNLRKSYGAALEKLALTLTLEYGEVLNFVGDVQDGAWGARRLKELFKGADVAEQLDSIVKIADEYRAISNAQVSENAACR
jgi:hypothetical protein